MLLHHSLKRVFAIVAHTSSVCSLSNWVPTTTNISSSSIRSALHSTASSASADTGSMKSTAKNLLFDLPVSNNGGRARIIL